MLDGNEAVAELAFKGVRPIKQGIEGLTEIEVLGGRGQVGLGGHKGLQFLGQAAAIHPRLVQDPVGQALLVDQGGEQVFGFDLGLAFLLGELLGGDDRTPGLFGEQFSGGLHGGSSLEGLWTGPYGGRPRRQERSTEPAGTAHPPQVGLTVPGWRRNRPLRTSWRWAPRLPNAAKARRRS